MNAPLRRLAAVVALLFTSLLVSTTFLQVIDASALNARPGNARSLYKEFGRDRGPLLVGGEPIADSVKVTAKNDPYGFLRTYPGGAEYSAVTGYYSILFGSTGLESTEGDLLSGRADQLFYRRISDLLTNQQPQGASVELTIDPKVQDAAWNALGNQRGAVVAIDPSTGDVLAMVSKPSFDPNQLAIHSKSAVTAARNRLLADPNRPMDNRAIASRLYPPGSVFKLITSAAALSTGNYTPDTIVPGPAELVLPQTNVTLPNDTGQACGPNDQVSLIDALRISCNTAYGSLGMALGQDVVRKQAEAFGFGQDVRIPLKVTPSQFPAQLSQAQLAQSSIGQFDVRVSPLQVAMVAAGIANGGLIMQPNLVRTIRSADMQVLSKSEPKKFSQAVSPDVATMLTTMMEAVVNNGTGTRAQIDGVQVAGKTGTAQQGDGKPPHVWFTAFAPAEAPKVAVAVVVEDGGKLGDAAFGGTVSAPIARQVIMAVLGK